MVRIPPLKSQRNGGQGARIWIGMDWTEQQTLVLPYGRQLEETSCQQDPGISVSLHHLPSRKTVSAALAGL